jgi:hypothetical protein
MQPRAPSAGAMSPSFRRAIEALAICMGKARFPRLFRSADCGTECGAKISPLRKSNKINTF